VSQADEVPIYSSPPVLCARCGHHLADHERQHHSHSWICWAAVAEGTEPCACEGCQDNGPTERRCACRSFKPKKPGMAEATKGAST
jgi:hypothetical protein